MLLILVCFGRGICVAHRFFLSGGGSVLVMFCFVLGGIYVLLIVFHFGRGIRLSYPFLFCEGVSCCTSFLCFRRRIRVAHYFFCFEREFRVAQRFFCFGRVIRVVHRFLFWEGDPWCSLFFLF